MVLPKGRTHLEEGLPEILADATVRISESFRVLLTQLKLELEALAKRIGEMDRVMEETAKENEDCLRLTTIPGIGPVTATALVAAVGNATAFRRGRDLAAWVGMVPREHSTGGKQKLLGISKRGNSYTAPIVRAVRTKRDAASKQTARRREQLARTVGRAYPSERRHCGACEQVAANRLGSPPQERDLQNSGAGHGSLSGTE